jgi:scyllo-inositol 2-dehydrogenase (NADP+)
MRVVVAGFGVQGKKRRLFAGTDCVAVVDPVHPDADFRALQDVPLERYDAVLACIPDAPKCQILNYCVANGKHVLVEKPLWFEREEDIVALDHKAQDNGVIVYTAYNHRFEPHYVAMRDLIASGELGEIYSCRMFYGNGTARLVRESVWRDEGAGVLPDLGSHLLDTCRFWFGDIGANFTISAANSFENRALDHVIVANESNKPRIELEMTLLMWRNHFTCDILAEKGTAHIASLCKWGPTTFTHRTRILPSGRPPERSVTLVEDDPTWQAEYAHFKQLCANGAKTDLANDLWLHQALARLGRDALSLKEDCK